VSYKIVHANIFLNNIIWQLYFVNLSRFSIYTQSYVIISGVFSPNFVQWGTSLVHSMRFKCREKYLFIDHDILFTWPGELFLHFL